MAAYEESEEKPRDDDIADEELQSTVSDLIESAIDYVDNTLSPEREKATNYYTGQPFGNEEDGRSQVVLTEVADAVDGVMPGLIRVFVGPDHTVEFEPVGPEDVEEAAQKTDYARYVFERDNNGFLILHATLKDGLLRKIGAVKWGWEESQKKQPGKVKAVSAAQLAQLQGDDSVEIVSARQVGTAEDTTPLYDVEYARVADGRVWVEEMPPEELIFTEATKTLDGKSGFVGHRTYKSKQELLDMGVDEDIVEEYGKSDDQLANSIEEGARRLVLSEDADTPSPDDLGDDTEEIRYVEGYMRVEGVLRQICTIGPSNYIVKNVPVEQIQMAAWTPIPEPHTLAGLSLADKTMDMQLIKSSLFRGALDSLSLALYPRTAYQEGQVSVEDVLNTDIGAPIRTSSTPSNVLQVFTHDWKGRDALDAMAYVDGIVEKRIGKDQGSMGLDADALQSSTKTAVDAAVSASQERTELMARMYAEMLLKPLFKGIVKLLVKHQPRKRMIRLRNKWVEMDPRSWNVDMDAVVKVALGSSMKEEKLAVLAGVKQTQEAIFQLLGPENPLVKLWQYWYTLKTGLELAGYKDTHNFFTEVPKDWAPPPTPPKPSPEELLAQIEQQKMQMQAQQKAQELQLRQMELESSAQLKIMELEQRHQIEQEKLRLEMELKVRELELKYATNVNEAEIERELQLVKEKARIEAENIRTAAQIEADERKHDREMEHAAEKARLDAAVKRETAVNRKDKGKSE